MSPVYFVFLRAGSEIHYGRTRKKEKGPVQLCLRHGLNFIFLAILDSDKRISCVYNCDDLPSNTNQLTNK